METEKCCGLEKDKFYIIEIKKGFDLHDENISELRKDLDKQGILYSIIFVGEFCIKVVESEKQTINPVPIITKGFGIQEEVSL